MTSIPAELCADGGENIKGWFATLSDPSSSERQLVTALISGFWQGLYAVVLSAPVTVLFLEFYQRLNTARYDPS
jgi:hypothetical protein